MKDDEVETMVNKYTPGRSGRWRWFCGTPEEWEPNPADLPEPIFHALAAGTIVGGSVRLYESREDAIADLRQAIRASGTDAAKEQL